MPKKSSHKSTANAQPVSKNKSKQSPFVGGKVDKGKTPKAFHKRRGGKPQKEKIKDFLIKGPKYSKKAFSKSSKSVPIDLNPAPKTPKGGPNPQKGSGKLKVDIVTDKHLSNAGVSQSRPEMIMQLNFIPGYRGVRGTSKLPVIEMIELQSLARQLHVESVGKMIEELSEDERLENEIEMALDRYDALVKDVRVDVGYLVGLHGVIKRIKRTLSIKKREERILRRTNRQLKRRGGGIRSKMGSAQSNRSLDTLSQLFVEDLGFSEKGYSNFSGTKLLGQLIYDLKQAMQYFSPRMFDYSDPSRFRDVDPLLVNETPGVANEDFIFTMSDIADFDINDGGARDLWESMLENFPTKKEQRSSVILNSILRELKASNRAASKRFLNWADNYSSQLGDDFIDDLLGDPSDLLDSRSAYVSGMSKYIVPREVEGYNVLPFENAVIQRDDEAFIPGGIHYAEGLLQNDEKLKPGEYAEFAKGVFKHMYGGGGIIGQLATPKRARRRKTKKKKGKRKFSNGIVGAQSKTSAAVWGMSVGGAMNGFLNKLTRALAVIGKEYNAVLGFTNIYDAPVIQLAHKNKDVRWLLFRWCVTFSNHQAAMSLGDFTEEVRDVGVQVADLGAAAQVLLEQVTEIERTSPYTNALEIISEELRQAVSDDLKSGKKGTKGYKLTKDSWNMMWGPGRFGGHAQQLLEQMRSLREGSRGSKRGGPFEFQSGNTVTAKYQPRTRWNNVTYDGMCFLVFEFMMTSLDVLTSNRLAFSVKYLDTNVKDGDGQSTWTFRINSSGEDQERINKAGYYALTAFLARDPDEESVATWKTIANRKQLRHFENSYEYLEGIRTRCAGEVKFISRAKAVLQSVGWIVQMNAWRTRSWIRAAARGQKRKQRQLQVWKSTPRGHMILETLSRSQLILRQVAIDHQDIRKDDDLKLPAKDLIYPQQMIALDAMLKTRRFRSPRADNLNVLAIGIPARMLRHLNARTFHVSQETTLLGNKRGDVIQVRVYKRDLEYDDIIFKPLTYTFDMSLFLSGKFSYEDVLAGDDFQNITYNVAQYRNYRPAGLVSSKTGDEIIDSDEYGDILKSNRISAMLRNHLRSDLLKTYIRVLTGINLDEQVFEIDEELFQENFGPKSQDFIRKIVQTFVGDEGIETEEEMIEFQETIKMIKTLTKTVLLSGKTYSTTVRSPTIFDRIFCVSVDPDDFSIDVSETISTESGRKALYTVLFGKKIRKIKRRGVTILKMKERKRNEGKIAMYDYFVTVQVVRERRKK